MPTYHYLAKHLSLSIVIYLPNKLISVVAVFVDMAVILLDELYVWAYMPLLSATLKPDNCYPQSDTSTNQLHGCLKKACLVLIFDGPILHLCYSNYSFLFISI